MLCEPISDTLYIHTIKLSSKTQNRLQSILRRFKRHLKNRRLIENA